MSPRGLEILKVLGEHCSRECSRLESLEGMGPGVIELPEFCFYNCVSLKSFRGLSPNVTKIGSSAFFLCKNITSVEGWPEHVETIEVNEYGLAFMNCTGLLPPELAAQDAAPKEVLTYLNEKSARYELIQIRYQVLLCAKHTRTEEDAGGGGLGGLLKRIAKYPPDAVIRAHVIPFVYLSSRQTCYKP